MKLPGVKRHASARTRSSPCPHPPSVPPRPSLTLRGRAVASARTREKINKIIIILYKKEFGCWLLEKRGKKCSVFGFQSPSSLSSPNSPSSPSSAGFTSEAARRRRFFWPSSPSHPSKLYSSLGWLNSKVPKAFLSIHSKAY
jgi:hypothetical protein